MSESEVGARIRSLGRGCRSVDDSIFVGTAARRYVERFREVWPHDETLARKHGASTVTRRFSPNL